MIFKMIFRSWMHRSPQYVYFGNQPPGGYYLTGYWLEGFTYRVSNSLWTILLTLCIVSLLTFCAVIRQTYPAAYENPASSIKES